MLELSLLGPIRARLANRAITHFYSAKTQALLVYLAVESAEAHPRTRLTGLLWPDSSQSDANRSLRQALFQLNKSLDNSRNQILRVSPENVQINGEQIAGLDVADFLHQLRQGNPERAVALYRGPFLDGFHIPESTGFEDWSRSLRESLHRQAVNALIHLMLRARDTGDFAAAQQYATQTLAYEPWQEEAHRSLMWALAMQGQRGAALAQYARCREILSAEVDAPPEAETVALYERIRNSALPRMQPSPRPAQSHPPVEAPPAHSTRSPFVLTPLIGRQSQLTQILSRLMDPHCRVLTLVGLSGVGKTRLAQEVVHILTNGGFHKGAFPDGVWFVSLREALSADGAVGVVAATMGIVIHSNQTLQEQVLHYLRTKRALLVLDNLEHLPSAAGQIAAFLDTAPGIKLLVTSQEALNLWDEWLFPVKGLPVPTAAGAENDEWRNTPAMLLFAHSAQRRDPDFQINREAEDVARICRLVDGLPLALELAASWRPLLTCAQIAARIEVDLDFLATSATRIPERHRSIRAVLDQSWALLSPEEQRGLRCLGLFRGSFPPQAAQEIASVPLSLLRRLLERTLLQATADRYQLHDLVRRYAEQKLLDQPQEHAELLARHSDFFLHFIAQHQEELFLSNHKEPLAAVDREFEQILLAWEWAAGQGRFVQMDQAGESLFAFCLNRGRYREGRNCFTRLVEAMEGSHSAQGSDPMQELIYGRALARQGFFAVSSGQMEGGMTALRRGLAIARSRQAAADMTFCLTFLGEFEGWQGNFDRGRQLLSESIAINEAMGELVRAGFALYRLGELTHTVGEFEEARSVFARCLAHSRQLESHEAMGYVLDQYGYCHFLVGDWDAAESAYRESAHRFSEIGNELGVALASTGLGLTAWARGPENLTIARQWLTESIANARRVGHTIHLVSSLSVLGLVQIDWGDFAQARALLEEALALARQADFRRGVITCLNGLAHVCWKTDQRDEAHTLLDESFALATAIGLRPLLAEVMLYQAHLLLAEIATLPPDQRHTPQEQAATLLRQVLGEMPLQALFRGRAQALLAELSVLRQ